MGDQGRRMPRRAVLVSAGGSGAQCRRSSRRLVLLLFVWHCPCNEELVQP